MAPSGSCCERLLDLVPRRAVQAVVQGEVRIRNCSREKTNSKKEKTEPTIAYAMVFLSHAFLNSFSPPKNRLLELHHDVLTDCVTGALMREKTKEKRLDLHCLLPRRRDMPSTASFLYSNLLSSSLLQQKTRATSSPTVAPSSSSCSF